jgi:ferritin-like metal-binding protein YciE
VQREGERIVHYLREARSDELALARTLLSHIAAAPRGPYRSGLKGYLDETREHARRVDRRLRELGCGERRLRSGARTLTLAGAGALAWGRGPLNAVRRARPEERLLRGAKYGCATEGLVIATYTALEVVATSAGDPDTALLAADIRADEERMLEWLRHEILKLTDPFIRSALEDAELPGDGEVSLADVREALTRAERGGSRL